MRNFPGLLAVFLAVSTALAVAPSADAAPKKARASAKLSQKQASAKKRAKVKKIARIVPSAKRGLKRGVRKHTVAKHLKGRSKKRKQALALARHAPKRYLRRFSGIATAYVPIDTPMEGGRWTCTMRDGWATKGVAVDPRLIPLGSLLYIPGYGRALADDTGGRIKGRHVDVRLHSVQAMHRWGVKKVKIYVLRGPKRKKSRRLAV